MTAINRTASNVESLLQIEEIEDCNTSLAGDKTEVGLGQAMLQSWIFSVIYLLAHVN